MDKRKRDLQKMKQTSLAFGQRKSCTTVRECAVHTDLGEIRTCKYCFTISFLKKKCGSTPNVTTGDMLGQWGTKEQMLQRLLKNSEKKQRPQIVEVKQKNTFSDGAGKSLMLFFLFCQPNIIATIFVVVLLLLFFWPNHHSRIILFYIFRNCRHTISSKTAKETELVGINGRRTRIPDGCYHYDSIQKRLGSKRVFEIQEQVCQTKKRSDEVGEFPVSASQEGIYVCLFVC